jgi:hypothetical protein
LPSINGQPQRGHLRVVDNAAGEGQVPQIQPGDLVRLEGPEFFQDAGDLPLQVARQVA